MARLITREGFKKLQEELDWRKTVMRQEIAQAIKEAKEQGDLSENAEYAEAKRQQNENEARVAELEMIIKDSQIVKHDRSVIGIQIGSRVKVKFNGSEMEFQIVGSNEANPTEFKISNESPMGRAFMSRVKGDAVEVETPNGRVRYKILDVK
ncbi:MAG: transcription elongation factor GreA [Candidatus Moranbacteria bacterium]|nr:transcription elongation factor GreA [Candidatus Moranbacteria bacterium]